MDNTTILEKMFLAFSETVKAVLSEPPNSNDSTVGKISPDGILYYNRLAKQFNELYPNVQLMLFREDSAPHYVYYPKASEVYSQIAIALDILNKNSDKSSKQANRPKDKQVKPNVFVGCSVEGLNIAKIIQLNLEFKVNSTIWSQGVFGLSFGTLESLVAKVQTFDYAIMILTPDDVVIKRDSKNIIARDNVMFELGLFMGSLGREKTFIVCDNTVDLPSDLAGITPAIFSTNDSDNIVASLGPICTKLEIAMNVF